MLRSTTIAFALVLVCECAQIYAATASGVPIAATSDFGDANLRVDADVLIEEPQRVDYRDREDVFDLDLLGAATGMCSLSGDCDACYYRDSNPCQVADRYGADTSLCLLPSFLGGNVSSNTLCGMGATVDVALTAPYSSSSSDGELETVATLVAFRRRDRGLVVTVTARCGWVLVPFESTLNSSSSVVMEANVTYMDVDTSFTTLAALDAGEVERYSCYSNVLRLRGLPSKCQALDLNLHLRLAVQRVAVVVDADTGDPMCQLAGRVAEASAHLTMRVPQAVTAATSATKLASTTDNWNSVTANTAKQNLFSDGVAAVTKYSALVDPRDKESVSWLQSLGGQFPLVSITPSSERLSFLIGTVRKDLRRGLGPTGRLSSQEAVLLQESLYLETCGRQSISDVVSAVVSALAEMGVTEREVSDVVCLQSPYTEATASELPPCAVFTSVLFNVTLDISMGPQNVSTTTSSLVQLSSVLGTRTSTSRDGTAASLQELADKLVGAQLAAPWACLSTERQMQMSTKVDVELNMPNRPGVLEVTKSADDDIPTTAPGTDNTQREEQPAPQSAGGTTPNIMRKTDSKSFSAVAIVAVAVAAALIAIVVLVAGFAIRTVRRSKSAAKDAVAAAKDAVAAAALAGARGRFTTASSDSAAPPPPAMKLASSQPSYFAEKKVLYSEPSGLDAEPSYASTAMYYNACAEPSLRGDRHLEQRQWGALEGSVAISSSSGSAVKVASATEGAMPWPESTSNISPAASAAALEPFSAAVAAAAVASTATAATAALECRQEEQAEAVRLSSTLIPLPTVEAPPATPFGPRQSTPMSPIVSPVTPRPLPPPMPITAGVQGFIARSHQTPPSTQPTPLRRNRTLRLPGASSSSSSSNNAAVGWTAGSSDVEVTGRLRSMTVWSNALYDMPGPMHEEGDEDAHVPTVKTTAAP